VIHPSSNSLFKFDMDGNFLWKYSAPAEIEGIGIAHDIAVIAIGRNVRNHDYAAHGAAAVSLADGRVLSEYHTKGPVQAVAISDDGKHMAAIEVTAVTPEGNLLGSYQLHIWDTVKKG